MKRFNLCGYPCVSQSKNVPRKPAAAILEASAPSSAIDSCAFAPVPFFSHVIPCFDCGATSSVWHFDLIRRRRFFRILCK